jgi:hypothetical protein
MADLIPVPPNPNYPAYAKRMIVCFNKTLPAVLDNNLTFIERANKVEYLLNVLTDTMNQLNGDYKALYEYVEKLYEILQQFMDSGFDDYYKEQVIAWIDQHMTWIFETIAKQVYFGLTMQGYFVAYIPQGWSDIVFDTGADYTLDTYGRLILKWDADSPYTVDQTPEKVRS